MKVRKFKTVPASWPPLFQSPGGGVIPNQPVHVDGFTGRLVAITGPNEIVVEFTRPEGDTELEQRFDRVIGEMEDWGGEKAR
jgi:hypothetical protein